MCVSVSTKFNILAWLRLTLTVWLQRSRTSDVCFQLRRGRMQSSLDERLNEFLQCLIAFTLECCPLLDISDATWFGFALSWAP